MNTKVKLTNAIDEALVSRGMLAPHLLLSCETEALGDTGATYLVMPEVGWALPTFFCEVL